MHARDRSGALLLGGVSANELANEYGTPLLVIDTDVFDAAVARFAGLAAQLDIDVAYAAKALFFVALARRLAQTPLSVDVCSLGELLTAERAGFPAERLVLHGCGKSDAELDAACAGRVGRIVVDGLDELDRLRVRSGARHPVDVVLRVNTGVAAPTHAAVRTAGDDTKFGFAHAAFSRALEIVRAEPGLRFAGVHAHVGSQVFEPAVFVQHVRSALDFYAQAAGEARLASPEDARKMHLIAGGGFGIAAQPGERDLAIDATLRELVTTVRESCTARGLPLPRLGVEPGRALIARAGASLYRVLTTKDQGRRRFAIVDGGVADNPRPALYGAYHHPSLAGRTSHAAAADITLCGRSCENDELVAAALPADLAAGDLLALESTGAYTFSMASNYNRFGRPAVAFSGAGKHSLAVRRESADDVLRNDVLADA